MDKSNIEEVVNNNNGYQIMVVNIKYGKILNAKIKERPDIVTLDVPSGILKTMDDKEKFYDTVESFAYKTITSKYGAEVNYCQVYLPLD